MNKLIYVFFAILLASCAAPEEEKKAVEQSVKVESIEKDVVEYHDNGMIKIRGKELNGKRVGKWESFYDNGYKWSENHYKDGYRDGPTVAYFKNGMMRYDGRYYNDERAGMWQFYDSTGTLLLRLDMDLNTSVPDSLLH